MCASILMYYIESSGELNNYCNFKVVNINTSGYLDYNAKQRYLTSLRAESQVLLLVL